MRQVILQCRLKSQLAFACVYICSNSYWQTNSAIDECYDQIKCVVKDLLEIFKQTSYNAPMCSV